VEIFSYKLLRRKLKLDLVIAGNAGSKHFPVAGRYGQPILVAQRHIQIDWFWLNGWIDRFLNDLPFASELLLGGTAGPNHRCQQD
jgi:hypothetical protein